MGAVEGRTEGGEFKVSVGGKTDEQQREGADKGIRHDIVEAAAEGLLIACACHVSVKVVAYDMYQQADYGAHKEPL